MSNKFNNLTSQKFHLHFGHLYDQNGKKVHPDEIEKWFSKNAVSDDAVKLMQKFSKQLDEVKAKGNKVSTLKGVEGNELSRTKAELKLAKARIDYLERNINTVL